MADISVLPLETIDVILAFVPGERRYFYRQVSKTWQTLVDSQVTHLDLKDVPVKEIFTYKFPTSVIETNAETISNAEKALLTAAKHFKNLKKIKLGCGHKEVYSTYIGYPTILGATDRDGDQHPLLGLIPKKRALPDFGPVLQDVDAAVAKHNKMQETVLWTEYSLKRARDDIDPLVIVHLVKNCPKLTDLHLYGITRVTDDVLAAIVDLRPNIKQLNLINTSVSVIGLEYALKNLPNLENLSIGRTVSSGYLLCPPHRNFPYDRMWLLKDLPAWKGLRKLRLSYSCAQTMTPVLAKCKNLEKLHNVGVNAISLSHRKFPKLISLDAYSRNFVLSNNIKNHPQLEHLSLRGDIKNLELNAIARSVVKLTKFRLSVSYDSNITDAALIPIIQKHAKNLTSLELCSVRTISPAVLDFEFPALFSRQVMQPDQRKARCKTDPSS